VPGGLQRIRLTSQPPGARIDLHCGRGRIETPGERTPAVLLLDRRDVPCEVTLRSPGRRDEVRTFDRRLSPLLWWDVLVPVLAGGLAGWNDAKDTWFPAFGAAYGAFYGGSVGGGVALAADALSGAWHERTPAALDVRLEPEPDSAAGSAESLAEPDGPHHGVEPALAAERVEARIDPGVHQPR
jgi:hypothetical protein